MLVTALASVVLLFVPLALTVRRQCDLSSVFFFDHLFREQANINVTIGANGKLMYNPEWVNATSGDSVVFTFAARHVCDTR